MKVLITGATASQVSSNKPNSVPTFTSLVHKALVEAKHDVTWIEPSVSLNEDYLSEFDSILVGLAPPTSTAAHRIYGALSVAYYARELGTLRLMVDAPDPKRLWAGIRAIYNKPDELTKEFYSKRREYRKMEDDSIKVRIHHMIHYLYKEEWPKTIYPSLPWSSFPSVSSEIPMTNKSNLVGLNFDSGLLSSSRIPASEAANPYWVADAPSTKWTMGLEKTVKYPVSSVRASRWENNADVLDRMSKSVGCLVSTYSQGSPWWSPSIAQALYCGVPVVTDWTLSSMLGAEWSMLAHSIEELSDYDRKMHAQMQKIAYLEAIPTWKSSIELACNTLLRK